MTGKNTREIILEMIRRNKNKMPGKAERARDPLRSIDIDYTDVMDIVLYYISLQPDMEEITKISEHNFFQILRGAIREWAKKVEKQWGTVKTPLCSGSKEAYDRPVINVIYSALTSGPGPMGGTMSQAEHYEVLWPGLAQHKYLLLFFKYPEGLDETRGNWPFYKKHVIEVATFPKWRLKRHKEKLETVFDLAESVCQKLRE